MTSPLAQASRVYSESYFPGMGSGGPPPPDPDPTVTALVPATGPVMVQQLVRVNGTGYVAGSTVEIDQLAVPTTFVSDTQLTADYTPAAEGVVQFTVRNPSDKESNGSPFTVTAAAATRSDKAKTE